VHIDLEVTVPTESDHSPLESHASQIHDGFSHTRENVEQDREQHADLIVRFLAAMDKAGNPGRQRKLGSAVLQLTGQKPEYHWGALVADGQGHEREVLVFDDGAHGWSDSMAYSDRPRSPQDEVPPDVLRKALSAILEDNGVRWPEDEAEVAKAPNPSERDT
jgi:hypothetical protein